MKNIQTKISLLLVVLAFMANSCTDFVEPRYEPEFPWTTVDQFEMAVAMPYSQFVGGGWNEPVGVHTIYEMLVTDFSSPITAAAPNMEWPFMVGRQMREVAFEGLNWMKETYLLMFRTVAVCNEGLDFLAKDEFQNLFPEDSPEKINANIPRAQAELFFFRGFAYMYNALFFTPAYVPGGANSDQILPMKTSNINANNTPIATTQEVWEQIISDLKKAKSLMPQSYEKSGRLTYWAICGALARAYFYTYDFANAEKECTEIISHYSPMGLPSNPLQAWLVNFTNPGTEPKNEVMWMYNTSQSGQQNYVWTVLSRADAWGSGGRGKNSQMWWNMCKLSNTMLKKIGWMVDPVNGDFTETDLARADKRYGRYNLERTEGTTWWRVEPYKPADEVEAEVQATGDEGLYDKYEQNHDTEVTPFIYLDKYYRTNPGYNQNQPRMRVPEFYLMRAAIRLKNGDKNGAAADLKVIRDRAGLTGQWEITSANITEEDIDREVVIEMGGESVYLPYLRAMQKPILPGDRKGVAPVNPPYNGWYWKMPIDEIRINAGYIGLPDPNLK